jgi:hypothetical protein
MQHGKIPAVLLLSGLFTLSACPQPVVRPVEPASGGITPQYIPPGYDFPGDRAQIQRWADDWNLDKITPKAWNLWAGLNADSGQKWRGAALPIWETWCGPQETFGKTCGAQTRPNRDFRNAHQLNHSSTVLALSATQGGRSQGNPAKALNERVLAFNKFDPSMAAYIAQKHTTQGVEYDYSNMRSLGQLNSSWPQSAPISQRKVVQAPYSYDPTQGGFAASELKPVLYLVKKDGLTPVPLWQGLAASTDANCQNGPSAACHPDPTTWKTCVLVDPSQQGAPPNSPLKPVTDNTTVHYNSNFKCTQYFYAPISTLYFFQMDKDEADDFTQAQNETGLTAEAGDYAVLVGMHVNTKELVNWTWQTYWWQPGADAPDDFPGSKKGMTPKVEGAARNYAMCTAYHQTQGKDSQQMAVCFNPYLETSSNIPDGVQSNCMSCHGTATVNSVITFNVDSKGSLDDTVSPPGIGNLPYPANYTKPINFNNDTRFQGFTQTDFSWAIPGNATPPTRLR